MDLKFSTRAGGHEAFERGLVIDHEHIFMLSMTTDLERGVRVGVIRPGRVAEDGAIVAAGDPVWQGDLPVGPPPTRAFAMAAELCDEHGNTELPLPAWVK